jgi:hypothetical protein
MHALVPQVEYIQYATDTHRRAAHGMPRREDSRIRDCMQALGVVHGGVESSYSAQHTEALLHTVVSACDTRDLVGQRRCLRQGSCRAARHCTRSHGSRAPCDAGDMQGR